MGFIGEPPREEWRVAISHDSDGSLKCRLLQDRCWMEQVSFLSIFLGQRFVFPHATFMIRNIDMRRKKSNFMSAASNDLKSDPKQGSHSSWRNLLKADLAHYAREAKAFQGDRPGKLRAIGILLTPPLMCCALHRLAHAAFRRGWTRSARAIARINAIVHRASSILRPKSARVSIFRTPRGWSF
jgi:hypothetical protein